MCGSKTQTAYQRTRKNGAAGIDNQTAVDRAGGWWPTAKATMRLSNRLMRPVPGTQVVTSFYLGDVGPVLPSEVRSAVPSTGHNMVVYVQPVIRRHVFPVLGRFAAVRFELHPDPENEFAAALAARRAIIACLYLRKPMLFFPEIGHDEQQLNATMASQTGWALTGDRRRPIASIDWLLKHIDKFPLVEKPPQSFMLGDDAERAAPRDRGSRGARPGRE